MKQIHWTKTTMNIFLDEAILSDEEEFILKKRVLDGWTITKLSMELNRCPSNISAKIDSIRKKYDQIQRMHPDVMPKRYLSKKEEYLDTN